jgi:multidrug efflux pump subunit AcrB
LLAPAGRVSFVQLAGVAAFGATTGRGTTTSLLPPSRRNLRSSSFIDTLNDAFGQRQITQYFTQLNTYWVILEVTPELQETFASLERIYVKSPLTGSVLPLSAPAPLSVSHQGQFPAVTLSFNLRPGIALGQAVDAILGAARDIGLPGSVIATFQGNAQAFQSSLASTPALIGAALVVVYIILGVLYESYIHPVTILSTLPSAGVGAVLALRSGGMELSVMGNIAIILLIGGTKSGPSSGRALENHRRSSLGKLVVGNLDRIADVHNVGN